MPTGRKVVVLNDRGYDFENARNFGALCILEDSSRPTNVFDVPSVVSYYHRRLDELGVTQDDYLLFLGQLLTNVTLFNVWLNRYGKVNALLFAARERAYHPRTYTKDLFEAKNR